MGMNMVASYNLNSQIMENGSLAFNHQRMNQRQMKPQMSQQMSQQNALASGQIPFTFKLKNIENKRLLWCSGFPDFRFPVKHAKRVRNLQPHSLQGSDYIACFILFIGFAFHYESNCKLYVPNKKQCLMLAYFLM